MKNTKQPEQQAHRHAGTAALLVVALISWAATSCNTNNAQKPNTHDHPQKVINRAPAHATIEFDPAMVYEVTQPLVIDKPLTVKGFSGQLPPGAAIHIMEVRSAGVTIQNIRLTGNAGTIGEEKRKALLSVRKGHFLIENSTFLNSSKDGIEVSNPDTVAIEHGVIRNIIGRGNLRDLVSINGENDGRIHHLLIEHIRCYNHPNRGAVEVSDGTENITVRKVFADSCLYAIDVQDHGYPDVVNHEIMIEGVIARNCRHAIRTANSDIGHARHTFRDITAIDCKQPLRISNIRNLYMDNITVVGQTEHAAAFAITNCHNVTISHVVFESLQFAEAGLALLNCDDVYINHVRLAGKTAPEHGITYNIEDGGDYNTLMIFQCALGKAGMTGMSLSARNGSTLSKVLIENNIATIDSSLQ